MDVSLTIPSPSGSAKPKLFIGCAKEDLAVAKAIEQNLWRETEVTVWDEDKFDSTHAPIETLLKLAEQTDFAILIFSPLDPSRHKESKAARDNVIFEAGLFLGKLNRNRVFLVKPENCNQLRLPSDLSGLDPLPYEDNRTDNNWIAAVSPTCNHIRTRIIALRGTAKHPTHFKNQEPVEKLASEVVTKPDSPQEEVKRKALEERGIILDKFSAIGIPNGSTTAFFHERRFTQAFPGIRGVEWFDNPLEIIKRLNVLLAPPLSFYDTYDTDGGVSGWDPIWWWRGTSTNSIDSFEVLGNDKVLLDYQELLPCRLAAINNGGYYQSYVYLEFAADKPTGLRDMTPKELERLRNIFGYASEEFGIFDGHFVTRAEYDDGAAIIDGKLVNLLGRASLRVRYLTPYNFIIAPKESPINNSHFDSELSDLMNKLLEGDKRFDELVQKIKQLPRRENYFK